MKCIAKNKRLLHGLILLLQVTFKIVIHLMIVPSFLFKYSFIGYDSVNAFCIHNYMILAHAFAGNKIMKYNGLDGN